MKLRGQQEKREAGYAMAALLVALSVMSILASAAMPTWRQMSQREKEAELIFRGQQYARAIGLFQRRAGPGTNPPNLDVLVQQRFLRKKYKDPITGGDFDLISPTTAMAAATAPGARGAANAPGARAFGGDSAASQQRQQELQGRLSAAGRGMQTSGGAQVGFGGNVAGGIVGVASKSKEKSIRIYNGRNYYNEWQFVYVPPAQAPGATAGAPGAPGGGGQRGIGPRGNPPGGGRRGFGTPPTFPNGSGQGSGAPVRNPGGLSQPPPRK
jgi:type II secretory pathway pseudopilin PulG